MPSARFPMTLQLPILNSITGVLKYMCDIVFSIKIFYVPFFTSDMYLQI